MRSDSSGSTCSAGPPVGRFPTTGDLWPRTRTTPYAFRPRTAFGRHTPATPEFSDHGRLNAPGPRTTPYAFRPRTASAPLEPHSSARRPPMVGNARRALPPAVRTGMPPASPDRGNAQGPPPKGRALWTS